MNYTIVDRADDGAATGILVTVSNGGPLPVPVATLRRNGNTWQATMQVYFGDTEPEAFSSLESAMHFVEEAYELSLLFGV